MLVFVFTVIIFIIIFKVTKGNNDTVHNESNESKEAAQELVKKMMAPVPPVEEEGTDVYLCIEYSSKIGKIANETAYSYLGYGVLLKDHEAYVLNEAVCSALKALIMQLADGSDLRKLRIAVAISYGSGRFDVLQPLTNDMNKLYHCISPRDIFWRENGGVFTPSSLTISAPYKNILKLVLKERNIFPKRKSIVVALPQGFEYFGTSLEYQKEIIQDFEECKRKQIGVITLGLKPKSFMPEKKKSEIDINLLKRCSTMPELVRICNGDEAITYLKELGQRFSNTSYDKEKDE